MWAGHYESTEIKKDAYASKEHMVRSGRRLPGAAVLSVVVCWFLHVWSFMLQHFGDFETNNEA